MRDIRVNIGVKIGFKLYIHSYSYKHLFISTEIGVIIYVLNLSRANLLAVLTTLASYLLNLFADFHI